MAAASLIEKNQVQEMSSLQTPESREQIINTAIKFLQNPRVKTTSLSQKREFLRQKGLTDTEIDIACQKSGAYSHEQEEQSTSAGDGNNSNAPIVPSRHPVSVRYHNPSYGLPFWAKARDVANLVALLSIGSYSLYALWTRYIAPKIFRTPSKQEEKFQKLLSTITLLNENISELKELILNLHTQQSQIIKSIHESNQSKELLDLKQELGAIKGLLLSRRQFPASPGIPSWQMVDKETGGDEDEGDSREESPDPKIQNKDNEGMPVTRKHSSSGSRDSIALHSDSSCEVVMIGGKNDSDHDHSDDA